MLEDFVEDNRLAILSEPLAGGARDPSLPTKLDTRHGIPEFLDQLAQVLRHEKAAAPIDLERLTASAGEHGRALLELGLTMRQVVQEYASVFETIVELALQQQVVIPPLELRTLNLCINDAIAEATTTYAQSREQTLIARATEHLGSLAHELRNVLNVAVLSFEGIKSGRAPVDGSISLMHSRSLIGLRDLIERSLCEVRQRVGQTKSKRFSAAELVAEVASAARLLAEARGLRFEVNTVDQAVALTGDWGMLTGALANLLNNAFKFTRAQTEVSLSVRASATQVWFDVEDSCGGLPPGKSEELFAPYVQRDGDRSGLGLGLAICQKAARASGGEVRVRDLPGKGCVFTLELPRSVQPLAIGGATATKREPNPANVSREQRLEPAPP